MDYLHHCMVEALRGHIPFIAPGTPPDEAALVQADIEHQQHRERIRDELAMRLQIQHNKD